MMKNIRLDGKFYKFGWDSPEPRGETHYDACKILRGGGSWGVLHFDIVSPTHGVLDFTVLLHVQFIVGLLRYWTFLYTGALQVPYYYYYYYY